MTGRKSRALQVPPVVPYKALKNFSKALYGTTRGTCSTRFFRSVMSPRFQFPTEIRDLTKSPKLTNVGEKLRDLSTLVINYYLELTAAELSIRHV